MKQHVLGVTPGRFIAAGCAEELAVGAVGVFAAGVAIATTGAGRPGSEDGLRQMAYAALHQHEVVLLRA